MERAFDHAQREALTGEYRLAAEPSDNRDYSLPAVGLLDNEAAIGYLERVNAIFEASTRTATASLFAKRYSCLTLASSLYAMGAYDIGMNVEIGNCHVESHHQGRAWLPRLRLEDWATTKPAEGDRERWRDDVLRGIFAGNLTRVWQSLAKAGPVSKAVLWENTAIYVFWLYESKFEEGLGDEAVARIRDDYDYIVRRAPGELFGETRNPLTKFDGPMVVTSASEKPLRLRKTCCYYYQATDEPYDYCPSCPKIKQEVLVGS
ncbi:IucA/IucC family C-terminal-domain containing protein [Cohnella sp. GCM10027633]|uniref:IucA/IucC family C-terminal-domain containing protein n=1 Tax=unclassified Cohnella TaxID=2636738 RepID=UPI0036337B43